MKIPSDNRWTQLNNGDVLGVLHETENCTLDKQGVVKLSRKAFNRYTTAEDADLGYILALAYYASDGQYFVLTDDNAFKFDFYGGSITEVPMSADVGFMSDAVVCYDVVQISTADNIDYYDTSLNTNNYALTNSTVRHPMCVFDSQPTYKLAVGDGNLVHLLSSAYADSGTDLTLPEEYEVTTLEYRNGYLYVGTKHKDGGEARIFVWNGSTANADFEVPVGASFVYSIKPYKSTVAFVTNQGQLMAISGNSAVQLAALPVYFHPNAIWDNESGASYLGKVLHRGMCVVGDTIAININGVVDSNFIPEMKSGVWVYDPEAGLYHRTFHSEDRLRGLTPSSITSGGLTFSSAHNLKDGDLLVIKTLSTLTGVKANQRYYVKVEDSTTVKLALSRKALKEEKYVTVAGSVGSSLVFITPNTDWRAGTEGDFHGAISTIAPAELFLEGWESPFIWGARFTENDGAGNVSAIMSFTEAWNIGRLTTQRIYSPNIKQTWKSLVAFFEGVLLDNEKIILKYKTETLGYPTQILTGVWNGTSQIDSNSSTLDEDQWSDIKAGDEITIVDGAGRGYTVHATADATLNGSTWELTVDEAVGTDAIAVNVYADKFKKLGVIDNTKAEPNFSSQPLAGVKSPWVQLKVEMRGFEIEFSMFDLINKVDQSST